MAKYKSPEENFEANRRKTMNQSTKFMIMYVDKPGETKVNPWGKEEPYGWYRIYNPDDEETALVFKNMLVGNYERSAGDVIQWDDFKITKNHNYKPIYLEWKPVDSEYIDKNRAFYSENVYIWEQQGGTIKPAKPVQSANTPTKKKEFFSEYNERELIFLLEKNGWEEIEIDIEDSKGLDSTLSTKDILISMCRARKVLPISEVKVSEDNGVLEGLNTLMSSVNERLEKIEEDIKTMTAEGLISLKDLLSKTKLAKLEEDAEKET